MLRWLLLVDGRVEAECSTEDEAVKQAEAWIEGARRDAQRAGSWQGEPPRLDVVRVCRRWELAQVSSFCHDLIEVEAQPGNPCPAAP